MQRGLTLVLPLLLVGCVWQVATHASLIDPSVKLARTCPSGVKLFRTESDLSQKYSEVALLTAEVGTKYSDDAGVIEAMRERASKVGANGVILGSIREPSALTQIAGEVAKTGTLRKGQSIAIFIPADSARVRLACSGKK